jgi:hypothetical protein
MKGGVRGMFGIVDRSDKGLVRSALLAGLGGGAFGLMMCLIVFGVGLYYGLIHLHPILHKLAIALAVFVISFLVTLGMVLQQAYWS